MPVYEVTSPTGQKLRIEGDTPPTDQDLDQIFQENAPKPKAPPQPGVISRMADMLPSVGGFVGGMAGKSTGAGVLGAAMGGAAGQGYKTLIKNASEIGPAIMDVGRNIMSQGF